MSVSSKLLTYSSKLFRAAVKPGQLVNIARSACLHKTEVVRWQPTHLSIFVTSRCNLRCDMCPTHSRIVPKDYPHCHRQAPDMSLELLRCVLDRYPHAVRAELIGVGEPLLNKNLFELISECAGRKLIVDTVSNGVALGSHITDIVHSRLDRICVSVNGHTAEEYQRITGMPQTAYSRILRNVEALVSARGNKQKRPRVEVSFIVDTSNYRHMSQMIEVAERLGVDAANFYNYLPNPYPGFTASERCLYEDDAGVCEELARLMAQKHRCEVTWPSLLMRFDNIPVGARKVCRWPFSLLQVDGNGHVGGCPTMMLNMHENGTINSGDIWNSEYFKDLRRRHLQGDVMEPCKSCGECVGVDAVEVVRRATYRSRPRPTSVATAASCTD